MSISRYASAFYKNPERNGRKETEKSSFFLAFSSCAPLSFGPALLFFPLLFSLCASQQAHNLQDPVNRQIIHFDAALEGVFHRKKTTFFALNKLLSGKLMDPNEVA